jgi:hypothetical protein
VPPQACNAVVAHPKRPNFNAFRRLNAFMLVSAGDVNRFDRHLTAPIGCASIRAFSLGHAP